MKNLETYLKYKADALNYQEPWKVLCSQALSAWVKNMCIFKEYVHFSL